MPAKCWKVVAVVEGGTGGPEEIGPHTRLIAVVMPNEQAIGHGWAKHRVSVRAVEDLTGYHFFDRVPAEVIEPLKEMANTNTFLHPGHDILRTDVMPPSATAAALQRAAAGLTYPSETDAAWTAFAWPNATGTPTADEVRRRTKHVPGSQIVEQSVETFFAPLIQPQDWFGQPEKSAAARNQDLFALVNQLLKNSSVFRIGRRKIAIYVVGVSHGGRLGRAANFGNRNLTRLPARPPVLS